MFRAAIQPTPNASHRVMSGIITGPHFRKFFNNPGPIEVGTMVAVLEIGAFSEHAIPQCGYKFLKLCF